VQVLPGDASELYGGLLHLIRGVNLLRQGERGDRAADSKRETSLWQGIEYTVP